MHQGAQVERPEGARPFRLGFSPSPACLLASGACPSFGFGVRPVIQRWSGVLVSQVVAFGGRGLESGRGGKVPGLKCLFLPLIPPSLFWISLAPGLTQFLSLPSRELAWTVVSVWERSANGGPGVGTCGGSPLSLWVSATLHVWLSSHFPGSEK